MSSLCGADCSACGFSEKCSGCSETEGKPFGGDCIAAELIKLGGKESFEEFKKQIIGEINALSVEGLPKINDLYCLTGFFVNLEYTLPNGERVKLLDDKKVYLGNQVENVFSDGERADRCYGIVAGMDFVLICEYGEGGSYPEIVLFKRR